MINTDFQLKISILKKAILDSPTENEGIVGIK